MVKSRYLTKSKTCKKKIKEPQCFYQKKTDYHSTLTNIPLFSPFVDQSPVVDEYQH